MWEDLVQEFRTLKKDRPVASIILNNGNRGATGVQRLVPQLYSRWHTKYGR